MSRRTFGPKKGEVTTWWNSGSLLHPLTDRWLHVFQRSGHTKRTGWSWTSPAVVQIALTWPPDSSARSSPVFRTVPGPAVQVTVPPTLVLIFKFNGVWIEFIWLRTGIRDGRMWNFLANWATFSFRRRTVLHGVSLQLQRLCRANVEYRRLKKWSWPIWRYIRPSRSQETTRSLSQDSR